MKEEFDNYFGDETPPDHPSSNNSAGFDSKGGGEEPTISKIFKEAGFDALTEGSQPEAIQAAIIKVWSAIQNQSPLMIALAKSEMTRRLKVNKIQGVSEIIKAVFKTKKTKEEQSGTPLTFAETEPWDDEVNGDELMRDLTAVFRKYLSLPEWADVAMALWAVHAWCFDVFDISPYLFFSSPEKRCGKSSALSVLRNLVPRPLPTGNASPAVIFRSIQEYRPVLILDEADTFLKINPELNGILNAGHTKSLAYVLRTEGDSFKPVSFSVWCPKIVAGIGHQKGTLEDRSIIISMSRKSPGERLARLRATRLSDELKPLRQKCIRWVQDNMDILGDSDPEVPAELNDRAADNWRPLLAIADLVGGDWPELARSAALVLSGIGETESDSYGVKLLADIQRYFQEEGTDKVQSDSLVKHLCTLEDRPWVECNRGKQITTAGLARLLKRFGVKSKKIRFENGTFQGYEKDFFEDAFTRYLPSGTPEQIFKTNGLQGFKSGTNNNVVPPAKRDNSFKNNDFSGVPLQPTPDGWEDEYPPEIEGEI